MEKEMETMHMILEIDQVVRGDVNERSFGELPCIFSVSKRLLDEHKEAYVPPIVSLGPYHFGKPQLREMEKYKREAAWRQQRRIQEGWPSYTFASVIEKMKRMEYRIRTCYDKEIRYERDVLCWIMARDASFILEFIRNYIKDLIHFEGNEVCSFQNKFSLIFGPNNVNPVAKSDIMRDIMKIENQLPLFVLEEVLAMEMGSIEAAKKRLEEMLKCVLTNMMYRPFDYFMNIRSPKADHILDMYHYLLFGHDGRKTDDEDGGKTDDAVEAEELAAVSPEMKALRSKLPSAVDIRKAGINITALSDGTFKHIKFSKRKTWKDITFAERRTWKDIIFVKRSEKFPEWIATADGKRSRERSATLFIAPITLDVGSEVIVRNLIALEVFSPKFKVKKMTEYAQFMDDLCQGERGTNVMREQGIIVGNLWDDSQISKLWNSSNHFASLSRCRFIKETRKELCEYFYRKWWIKFKLICNEFYETYASKPWLVFGGIGAFIILILTGIQVLCAFHNCMRR